VKSDCTAAVSKQGKDSHGLRLISADGDNNHIKITSHFIEKTDKKI